MGDVYTYLVDGTSGLAPGSVEGTAIVVGVCSEGEPGKAYLVGKNTTLETYLGQGPLVDSLRDSFATGGQNPVFVAVPVKGDALGYISPVRKSGYGPDASVYGVAEENADILLEITQGGDLGEALYRLSLDNGDTWTNPIAQTLPADGELEIENTGCTIFFASGDYEAQDKYRVTVRTPIGPVRQIGSGPEISVQGEVLAGAQVILQITKSGMPNEGQYRLSIDGGDSYSRVRTIPLDRTIDISGNGVWIELEDADYHTGAEYHFNLYPPTASISSIMEALSTPLETYDVECIHVAGPTDSVDWSAMGALADELWGHHRPTCFLAESRLPYDGEDYNDWTTYLANERKEFAHRFVAVCTAHGEVSDRRGQRMVRNWGGLTLGRLMSIPVMRSIARVRDQGIPQASLPDEYNETHQRWLQDLGYITAKRYAGLNAVYWGEGRTMAEDTSDYRWLEVLRTTFKAVRLARIQALKSLQDEAGDPVLLGIGSGLAKLKADIEEALSTMVKAWPQELAGHNVVIPPGQDIANNGVAVMMTLIGIPIIRRIDIYANYVYAGSSFDPRLEK